MPTPDVTPSNEIEQRKEKNPNDVDKVPVKAAYLERRGHGTADALGDLYGGGFGEQR